MIIHMQLLKMFFLLKRQVYREERKKRKIFGPLISLRKWPQGQSCADLEPGASSRSHMQV